MRILDITYFTVTEDHTLNVWENEGMIQLIIYKDVSFLLFGKYIMSQNYAIFFSGSMIYYLDIFRRKKVYLKSSKIT